MAFAAAGEQSDTKHEIPSLPVRNDTSVWHKWQLLLLKRLHIDTNAPFVMRGGPAG
jgi:hypothetical protein